MDQFREKGWHLSEEGLKKISEGGTVTHFPTLLKTALNTDLREIGAPSYPTEAKTKYEVPKQGLVLQIIKIRNIAAPKSNQDSKFAPRLLKIQFSDGKSQFSGIEMEHLGLISHSDTKPGTKLYFKPGKVVQVCQDLLLLRPSYFDVLGGNVAELVEKWEQAKIYSKYLKLRQVTQAPAWIPFGQKIDRKSVVDVNKKSFAGSGLKGDGGEEGKEDGAFDSQRKEAIAEAAKMEKKVFATGAKKIVHHNVQKIVDKGFTEEEAQKALQYSRNDLGRALANLKRPFEEESRFERPSGRGGRFGGGGRGGRGGRGGGDDESEEMMMGKPSEKISLFDFIGDKLPPEIKNAAPVAATTTTRAPQFGERPRQAPTGHSAPRFERGSGSYSQRQDNRNSEYSGQRFNNPGPGHSRGSHRGGGERTGNPPPTRYHNNNPHQQHQQQQDHNPKRNAYNSNYNQSHRGGGQTLVGDMERMSVSNRQHQGGQQQSQQPNQSTATNGSNYEPRRMPGFLNKESNEAAKKFLQQQQQQQPALSQGGPQFHQNHRQGRPPHNNQAAQSNQQSHFNSTWTWKMGDRCLAKYWEDGQYYDAMITGVAGRTCVVNFLEYNNFEEVLKEDILPITA